jgi:hypothetical protein
VPSGGDLQHLISDAATMQVTHIHTEMQVTHIHTDVCHLQVTHIQRERERERERERDAQVVCVCDN